MEGTFGINRASLSEADMAGRPTALRLSHGITSRPLYEPVLERALGAANARPRLAIACHLSGDGDHCARYSGLSKVGIRRPG